MVLNYNIPMRNESLNGIFQDMLSKGKEKKLSFDSSPYSEKRTNILYDNSSYFCTTNNKNMSENYFIVHFKDRVFYPTGYVMKSLQSGGYLRGWDLFGSLDGNKWSPLHSASESDDLCPPKAGRYEINGGPFRYFKIVQASPCSTSDENYKYKMRITYLDFFGFSWNGLCTNSRRQSQHFIGFVISFIIS